MKTQRLLVVLTTVNLGLLLYQAARLAPAEAGSAAPVLRGRALEIVDDQGKVRASIAVYPADKNVKMPNGKTLPETVLLRLINPNGRPAVKLATSEQGAGLVLSGNSGPTYALLNAEDADSSLKLTTQDGRQQLIKP